MCTLLALFGMIFASPALAADLADSLLAANAAWASAHRWERTRRADHLRQSLAQVARASILLASDLRSLQEIGTLHELNVRVVELGNALAALDHADSVLDDAALCEGRVDVVQRVAPARCASLFAEARQARDDVAVARQEAVSRYKAMRDVFWAAPTRTGKVAALTNFRASRSAHR